MSRAFVKEQEEAVEALPDRPISTHRNLVTPEGLAAIEAELARLRAALDAARAADDPVREASAARDLRYWTARRSTAQVVAPAQDADEVRFGATVTVARRDGEVQTFKIVGEDEADPAAGTLSYVSPLAQALMGKGEGEEVQVVGGAIRILKVA